MQNHKQHVLIIIDTIPRLHVIPTKSEADCEHALVAFAMESWEAFMGDGAKEPASPEDAVRTIFSDSVGCRFYVLYDVAPWEGGGSAWDMEYVELHGLSVDSHGENMHLVVIEDRVCGDVSPMLCRSRKDVTNALAEHATVRWDDAVLGIVIPYTPELRVELFYGDKSGYLYTIYDGIDYWQPSNSDSVDSPF